MEVRVLGPVEVWKANKSLHLARRQQRLILGILALDANHPVSSDRLIDLVWGGSPPAQARAVIQSRVSELRAALTAQSDDQDGRLLTQGNGYVLSIRPELVDAHRFRRLVSQARDGKTDDQTRGALRKALNLWRGAALGGWLPEGSHAALCRDLESAHLTAMEDLFEVELRLGHHRAIADEMLKVSIANLGREHLTALSMLALYRSGRTAEAIGIYDSCRRWLVEELGVDPGVELQDLHVAILRGDPKLAIHGVEPIVHDGAATELVSVSQRTLDGPDGFTVAVPRILPADIPDFTGRATEVALLCDLLTRRGDEVRLVAVAGPAGIGKTALSIHVAHRLRDDFPDGQLFANLHGMEADEPTPPFEVLGRFLRTLSVDGLVVPSTLDERVDLYRGLLADRRVLVVLDDAGTADQVLPLVPGSASCAMIVNSRTRLGHAVGAQPVSLDVLDPQQATELLSRIAGTARIGSEPAAAVDLARICGYLPLALRVAAAKLAAKPHWTVERLVDRLADERRRLDHLTFGHLDVRSSIALSHAGLSPDGQQLLRRLGDIDVPDVNVWTSAALLDTTSADAEEVLEQLYDAQLVDIAGREPTGHARYRLHDLVRLMAREHSADDSAGEMMAVRERAFGAWLYLVDATYFELLGVGATHSAAPRWPVDGQFGRPHADPLLWFDDNRHMIAALIRRAATWGHHQACWDLACTASELFELRRYYDEWEPLLAISLAAAQHAADVQGQAATHHRLGMLCADQQDYQQARDHFRTAADLFERIGDLTGYAMVTAYTGMVDRWRGNDEEALRLYEEALRVLPAGSNDFCHIYALRSIGQTYLGRGEHAAAADFLDQALAVARRLGNGRAEAMVLVWQAHLLLAQHHSGDARSVFAQVLTMSRQFGDRSGEIQAMRGIARSYQADGDLRGATTMLHEARRIAWQPRPTRVHTAIETELAAIAAEATPE